MIRYSTQCIEEDDIEAVVRTLKSNYLTQGPAIEEFESNISKYVGCKYAIAVNSATSALHLACLALNVNNKSIVWTSPNSFPASANCALYCEAKVDFVDIDPKTFNISPETLESKLIQAKKNRTLPDILIVVHFAGQSCDMEKIHQLSKIYGFKIIEDASHALGAEYKGKKVGVCEFSSIAVFSFHPVKMITTGEGGLLTTNDKSLDEVLRSLRSHGIVKNSNDWVNESHGSWYFEQQRLGFNFRLTEIQAALGLSQLKKLDRFVQRRREIADYYHQNLNHLPLKLPEEIASSKMSYHLYTVLLIKHFEQKKEIFSQLVDLGIGVQVHYIPIYKHPFYQSLGFTASSFPNSEQYYRQTLSIPNHPKLSHNDLEKVVEGLSRVLV